MRKSTTSLLLFGFLFLMILEGKTQTIKDTTALSEVILIGSPIKNTMQKTASSVARISAKEINQTDGVILTPLLNKTAGVYMQQGTLNTNRITIRGIGARSQFSTNRVKAYFEEIPLSTGEGETTLEDIDLSVLNKIEIIKGPNSSSFGAGLGGVINLFGNQSSEENSFIKSSTTVGSFGLIKNSFSSQMSNSKTNLYANYSNLQSEGFRANSSYDRQSINLFGKHQLSEKGKLNFIGIATRLKVFIPSSINQTDFDNSPEIAAANWAAARGYESYDKLLLGIGYDFTFSEKWNWNSTVFSNFKEAYEPRPFDILEDNIVNFGVRSKLNYTDKLFSIPTKMSVGTELLREKYTFSLYENLYQTQPNQGSIQGDKFSDGSQNRNYINLFWQIEMQLSSKLNLESGLAFNQTNYTQKDEFETDSTTKENYSFDAILSPRIGLSYEFSKGKNLYFSVNKGFSHPTVAETLTPEGQLNPDILPEIGINYEIGFKGNFLKNKIYTEVNLYATTIKNLLVARRVAEDQYVGINAGESLHQGIEFLINGKLLSTEKIQLNSYVSGSLNHFEFVDFIDNDNDFSGNQLPSVPEFQWNFGLDFTTKSFTFSTSYRTVGKMFLNDANSLSSQPYQLLDINTNYTFSIWKDLKANLQFGIQNSLNEKYAASILPNAVGFGNVAPRYFYPGNPRNYYGGMSLNYQFN
ncbi:TonB-dependent receptor [Flavobacterium azooxidireducens]|uniref:TonB-dependent receptor n=1 Tax=Flavobacterium azooxidireducens TaxID=1871076 RepID=A0ABY4KJG0_9FLAO|nr:TonB-dependent receptor [Flavobacterium azooxidireducens]UPQ79540.1 TonB-dependent receptor [Flavobacterium azooxidireducens]